MKLSTALLFVLGTIAHGASASANVGQSATFTATADGSLPFNYQWYKDGAALPGATANPMAIASVATEDAGNYTVKVSNSAGSTLSDIASLAITSVSSAPDFSAQYTRATLSITTTMAAGVWTTIKGATIEDPGAHYSASTGFYTVGASEAGRYQIIIRSRAADMAPEAVSYAICAGTANQDGAGVLWCTTNAHGPVYMRNGAVNIVEATFAAGDQIRVFIYTTSDLQFYSVDFTIKRIG